MSDNFLSRWSKRKLEAKEQDKQAESSQNLPDNLSVHPIGMAASEDVGSVSNPVPEAVQEDLPLPTEADLQAVEQGGDIKAFMVDKVSVELKNKAFKTLFSRPEFNVMDGLDIYIDDYNKFTPLSQGDIAKMSLSKQLLSRPDLDLPKIGAVQDGLNILTDSEVDHPEQQSSGADKTEVEQILKQDDIETEVGSRVIPDEQQVVDIQEQLEDRSFETSPKK